MMSGDGDGSTGEGCVTGGGADVDGVDDDDGSLMLEPAKGSVLEESQGLANLE